ncbi:RNA-binding protein [Phreatobacter aquaticus]|nr:RNA-binding protein [Phreatobacter aquaticus]
MMMTIEEGPDLNLDAGPRVRRGEAERTCIVNRTAGSPDGLIRFVIDPEGVVIADLKAKLPGRGAWVTATRAALTEAVRRKAFARAFKSEVTVPADIADRVDALLEGQALSALSLANKAGAIITGFSKVEAAASNQDIAGLIHASDAGEDGVKKQAQAVRRRHGDDEGQVARVTLFDSSQLDLALGRMNVVHAALLAGGPSAHFLARCAALEVFRSGALTGGPSPASVNEPKH